MFVRVLPRLRSPTAKNERINDRFFIYSSPFFTITHLLTDCCFHVGIFLLSSISSARAQHKLTERIVRLIASNNNNRLLSEHWERWKEGHYVWTSWICSRSLHNDEQKAVNKTFMNVSIVLRPLPTLFESSDAPFSFVSSIAEGWLNGECCCCCCCCCGSCVCYPVHVMDRLPRNRSTQLIFSRKNNKHFSFLLLIVFFFFFKIFNKSAESLRGQQQEANS